MYHQVARGQAGNDLRAVNRAGGIKAAADPGCGFKPVIIPGEDLVIIYAGIIVHHQAYLTIGTVKTGYGAYLRNKGFNSIVFRNVDHLRQIAAAAVAHIGNGKDIIAGGADGPAYPVGAAGALDRFRAQGQDFDLVVAGALVDYYVDGSRIDTCARSIATNGVNIETEG